MRKVIAQLGIVLALSLGLSGAALASSQTGVEMENGSGVKITIYQYFESVPTAGYQPVQVKIENRSGRARSWDFTFNYPMYSSRSSSFTTQRSWTVEDAAIRTFDLLVPIASAARASYSSGQIGVNVSGYGVKNPAVVLTSATRGTGNPPTPFVALSNKLAGRSWGVLEEAATARTRQLAGTRFDANFMPADWRAYAGVSAIWITDGEWNQLTESVKIALKGWLATGGRLFVVTAKGSVISLSQFGGSEDGTSRRVGLGSVSAITWDGRELDAAATLQTILRLGSLGDQLGESYRSNWNASEVGALTLNLPLLIGYMILFALLIGPINLFVFARSGSRHRLFWTTPLIAVAASVLLAGVIVLQDGFGGSGLRLMFVQLLPAENEAVVLQEQVSRTGVVLAQDFHLSEPALLAPVNLDDPSQIQARHFAESENAFGGDWFRSRSIQAEFGMALRPTRSRIALLNAAEVANGAAPVILSSIEGTLDELTFVDQNRKTWWGEQVRTGEKVTLAAATREGFPRWRTIEKEAGPCIKQAMEAARQRGNVFYGTSHEATGVPIETLPSIRWTKQQVVWAGPVSGI